MGIGGSVIFMSPTRERSDMTPSIVRIYSLSFLLLPFNIFSTCCFQAIIKPRAAFTVSVHGQSYLTQRRKYFKA